MELVLALLNLGHSWRVMWVGSGKCQYSPPSVFMKWVHGSCGDSARQLTPRAFIRALPQQTGFIEVWQKRFVRPVIRDGFRVARSTSVFSAPTRCRISVTFQDHWFVMPGYSCSP